MAQYSAAAKGCGGVVLGGMALLFIGTAALVSFSIAKDRLSSEDRTVVESAIASAGARALEMDRRWKEGLARRDEVTAGTGRCARVPRHEPGALAKGLGLQGASGPDLDEFVKQARASQAMSGASNELVVAASAMNEAQAPCARWFRHEAELLQLQLDEGRGQREELLSQARKLSAGDFCRWDLVVSVEARRRGGVNEAEKTFEGGVAAGRAWVFDYDADRVTCVGEFTATNSKVVEYSHRLGEVGKSYGAISQDLDAEILDAARESLFEVARP